MLGLNERQSAQGKSGVIALKEADVSELNFDRLRKEYCGLKVDQFRQMKDRNARTARLRRPMADLFVDKQVLADVGSGARPTIPPQRHEAPVACPDWIYNNPNQVKRLWARLKKWRAIASCCEKTAASFMGILRLAAALDWLKR